MIHPRNIYIQCCKQLGLRPQADYFDDSDFNIAIIHNSKTKRLMEYLQSKDKENFALHKTFEFFSNIDNRIMLDALLLAYTKEQILTIKNYDENLLEYYEDYFFQFKEIKGTFFHNSFVLSIPDKEVRRFFQYTFKNDFEDIKYFLDGKAERRDSVESLKLMKAKSEAIFHTYGGFPADFNPLKPERGLTKGEKDVIDIALKYGRLAASLMKDELKYDDKFNKSESNFRKEWQLILEQTDTTDYSSPLSEKAQAEFFAQRNQFPNKKISEASLGYKKAEE